jgi:hypothetical protein
VYAAASAVEADRIVLVLDEAGIEAIARATTMSSFPSPSESAHLVLVRDKSKAEARELIERARVDGVVTGDGEFL